MLSMSLGVSFSGLLHCIAESVVLVLSELIDQNSVKLLRKFLPRKKIELASPEMGLDSEFKNFKAANSSCCKHATSSSADSIMKQEHLFPDLRNEGSWSSKEELNQSGVIISHPTKRVCSNFCKGKAVLQASEAEDLNTRLEILEEESQIMKQALFETKAERKKLVNEIYKLFETRWYTLVPKDQEDGHTFSSGSLIIKPCKVFQFEPWFNFCFRYFLRILGQDDNVKGVELRSKIINSDADEHGVKQGPGQGTAESSLLHALLENPRSGDPNANALAILGQSNTSTQ